ncbi:MAG: type II secretion system F family protein [Desulfobacterales bacterium]|nr:type II secretion system F family protein [Deltaproteobacteria bacterium]NNL42678.1 type II secretion system F family protein [Desulfobacterales bacterium]
MPNYSYNALAEDGRTTKGSIEAESLDAATSELSSRGLIPTDVTEEASSMSGFTFKSIQEQLTPIKAPDLILFTKQFRTMIRAGVSMMQILQILQQQTENLKLKKILGKMQQDVNEGLSLHEAFKKHPKVFSVLYCSMVQAGEASGALPEILDRLTYIIEHEYKVKSDIKSALQYPIVVISFLAIAFIVLLTFVIPKFVNIFTNAGLKLPLPTKICMALYQFMANSWLLILGGVFVIIALFVLILRTKQGQYLKDSLLLKVPIIGQLLLKAAISRFASIFAILHSSGVDILNSMDILSGTIGNAAVSQELEGIKNRLEEGRGIAGPLMAAKYFTPMMINMVAIGEETGNLQDMLTEAASHYDTEVEYSMKKMSEAIGPMLTVGLAAVIGFFALAIFLPMWDLTTMVK